MASNQYPDLMAAFLAPLADPISSLQDSIASTKTDVATSILSLFGVASDDAETEGNDDKSLNGMITDAGRDLAKSVVKSYLTGG